MPHRGLAPTALALASLALTACASSSPSFEGTPSRRTDAECPLLGPSSFRATGDELRAAHVSDLFEAVRRVRPRVVLSNTPRRDQSAVVYLDGLRMGSVDRLRDIHVIDVVDVVFVGGADATTRFGIGHTGGALMVRTQQGPEGRQCPPGLGV